MRTFVLCTLCNGIGARRACLGAPSRFWSATSCLRLVLHDRLEVRQLTHEEATLEPMRITATSPAHTSDP